MGNTTVDAEGRTFIYDFENKQVKVLDAQQATVGEYSYDGDGKRVKKYVPATGELLQEIKETSKDKSQRSFQRFVARWSPNGNLLMTAPNENTSVLLWEILP